MKTKRVLILSIALLMVLGFAGCGTKTTTHKILNDTYSINVPENWEKKMSGSVPFFLFQEDNVSMYATSIVKLITFDDYISIQKRRVLEGGSTIDKTEAAKAGTLDAYLISYTRESVKFFYYIVNTEDEFVIISCSTTEANASKYEKTFANIIKSFKVL